MCTSLSLVSTSAVVGVEVYLLKQSRLGKEDRKETQLSLCPCPFLQQMVAVYLLCAGPLQKVWKSRMTHADFLVVEGWTFERPQHTCK